MERLNQIDKEQNRELREQLIRKCLFEISKPTIYGENKDLLISGLEIINKLI